MADISNKIIVLVLNRNWQAINIRTPQEAFCQMARNVATALEIEVEEATLRTPHSALRASQLRPVPWDEWIRLPIRGGDNFVCIAHSVIRVPAVIVAVNFARVPKKRPKLCARTIRSPREINAAPMSVWGLAYLTGQGQPPAARSWPEAAQGATRAEGTAGFGAHPQRPRRRRVETVPE